ncbi:hypothetical protein Hypma_012692 [Hypsizygus marmoreus]|uniref:Uncharacterized protein n=1 Tax=Hypsizygus marmoreus TaxID=39966 RepID=A0A369JNH9_HYPMA|nr:hypothetical protein Hypma_012692 [Hypsizygus marmoreus]
MYKVIVHGDLAFLIGLGRLFEDVLEDTSATRHGPGRESGLHAVVGKPSDDDIQREHGPTWTGYRYPL